MTAGPDVDRHAPMGRRELVTSLDEADAKKATGARSFQILFDAANGSTRATLFAGLGGAYLVIVGAQIYREGQTAGRGYIGLAAMIFGNWRPGGLAAGAGLFGYTDALQLRGGGAVHALLLLTAILLAGYGL